MRNNEYFKVSNLSKEYPTFKMNHVSFSLDKGEIVGIIGNNGSGKTTIIKSIMGLIECQGNIVYLDNLKIGYISENKSIYPTVKAKALKSFVCMSYKKVWQENKYQDLIKLFNIDDNLPLQNFSTGLRMKFFIALELSKKFDVLILDEPTSGLDPDVRNVVLQIIYNTVMKEGKSCLFSSHITEDIEKIASRIIYVDNGEIIHNEKKEETYKRFLKFNVSMLDTVDSELKSEILHHSFNNLDKLLFDTSKIDSKYYDYLVQISQSQTLDEVLLTLKRENN